MKTFRMRAGIYVHIFPVKNLLNKPLWREAVCGFDRTGTYPAYEQQDDPICPLCHRWSILVELAE